MSRYCRGILLLAFFVAAAACGGAETASGRRGGRPGTRRGALPEEAVAAFEAAVRAYRAAAEAGWNRERCVSVADAFKEAAEGTEEAKFHEAWFNRGMALHQCRMREEATEAFRRSLQAKEDYGPPRVMIGVYAYWRGNTGEAFRQFQQTIEKDAQNVEAYVNLAMLQRERNQGSDVREAQANIRRALAVDSQFLPAFNQLALLYIQEAENPRARNMLTLAAVVCKQATQIDSNYAPIWNTWGLIDVRQSKIIGALAKFEKAFTLNQRFFEAFMNFGAITLGFRGYEDARMAFGKATKLNRRSYEAHVGLGAALRGLEQVAEAKAEYEAARDIDAARPDVYFNLGLLYQDYMSGSIEDFDQAKQYLNQFIQRAQGRAGFADTIQVAQQRIRNIDETVAALREGMELQRIAEEQMRRQQEEERRMREQCERGEITEGCEMFQEGEGGEGTEPE